MSSIFQPPPPAEARALLQAMVGKRVAVIGDVMLDAYLFGRVGRISPEAPVPVFEIEREEHMLGGAANVAKCLVALGARVRLCGLTGRDPEAEVLRREAQALGMDPADLLADPARPTSVKRRAFAQRQQIVRLDREVVRPPPPALERQLIERAVQAAAWAEAVVLSDYAKGLLTPALCRAVLRAARGKPVVVDPKNAGWERFRGATLIKPNEREVTACLGLPVTGDKEAARAATRILKHLGVRHALITRDDQGMTLASAPPRTSARGAAVLHLRSHPPEVFDVAGAGDVVAAAVTLALAAGAPADRAAWIANAAAGVKVSKFGTAAVTEPEVLEALGHGPAPYERKLLSRAEAAALAARWRKAGRRVVFTNGCFDILHFGHVSYLEKSRRLGDALIVGVNTDASVRRLKGPGRPVQHERDRARIVASQGSVDGVVLFAEETPLKLIRAIRPAVLCKGADYRHKRKVVGWREVEGWGGRVVLVPFEAGRSTSRLLEARHADGAGQA